MSRLTVIGIIVYGFIVVLAAGFFALQYGLLRATLDILPASLAPSPEFSVLGSGTLLPGQAARVQWEPLDVNRYPTLRIELCREAANQTESCITLNPATPNDGDAVVFVPSTVPLGNGTLHLTAHGSAEQRENSAPVITRHVAVKAGTHLTAGQRVSVRWVAVSEHSSVNVEFCIPQDDFREDCHVLASRIPSTSDWHSLTIPDTVPPVAGIVRAYALNEQGSRASGQSVPVSARVELDAILLSRTVPELPLESSITALLPSLFERTSRPLLGNQRLASTPQSQRRASAVSLHELRRLPSPLPTPSVVPLLPPRRPALPPLVFRQSSFAPSPTPSMRATPSATPPVLTPFISPTLSPSPTPSVSPTPSFSLSSSPDFSPSPTPRPRKYAVFVQPSAAARITAGSIISVYLTLMGTTDDPIVCSDWLLDGTVVRLEDPLPADSSSQPCGE